MPVMLERWNDDKMDALDAKVDDHGMQLSEIRSELREQRKETRDGLDKLAEALREERKETGVLRAVDTRHVRLTTGSGSSPAPSAYGSVDADREWGGAVVA